MTPADMTERLASALARLKMARSDIREVLGACPWMSSDAEVGLAHAFNHILKAEICVEKAYYGEDDDV